MNYRCGMIGRRRSSEPAGTLLRNKFESRWSLYRWGELNALKVRLVSRKRDRVVLVQEIPPRYGLGSCHSHMYYGEI
jgi:hypothetical protein